MKLETLLEEEWTPAFVEHEGRVTFEQLPKMIGRPAFTRFAGSPAWVIALIQFGYFVNRLSHFGRDEDGRYWYEIGYPSPWGH